MSKLYTLFITIMFLFVFTTFTIAQVETTVRVMSDKVIEEAEDNIVIMNETYDPDGSCWTWRYNTESENDPPHRDLGQSFTPHNDMVLDKIYVEMDNELMQPAESFEACQNAPFHIDIYQFAAVGDPFPIDTLSSQSGTLPAELDSATIANSLYTLLCFDIENVSLTAENVYGFLLKFDEMQPHQKVNLNKTHSGDNYVEGAMYFVYFDGTNGRENVEIWEPEHPGANPNRDLNFWLQKGEAPSQVEENEKTSRTFSLSQNYPNPFNPKTSISFEVTEVQDVRLDVFSIDGSHVKTLIDKRVDAGFHKTSWSGQNETGQSVASGVYVYRLQVGRQMISKKMILMR